MKKKIEMDVAQKKIELRIAEAEHSKLDQISMLSGEGSYLRERINYLKGYIAALLCVIEGKEIQDDME
jgi:hypothetical protein